VIFASLQSAAAGSSDDARVLAFREHDALRVSERTRLQFLDSVMAGPVSTGSAVAHKGHSHHFLEAVRRSIGWNISSSQGAKNDEYGVMGIFLVLAGAANPRGTKCKRCEELAAIVGKMSSTGQVALAVAPSSSPQWKVGTMRGRGSSEHQCPTRNIPDEFLLPLQGAACSCADHLRGRGTAFQVSLWIPPRRANTRAGARSKDATITLRVLRLRRI